MSWIQKLIKECGGKPSEGKKDKNFYPTLKLFVTVGPPGIGKTTWVENNLKNRNPYIVSRDDIIEEVAIKVGWDVEDIFVVPDKNSKVGSVHEKYGTVIPAPPWIPWHKHVFTNVQSSNEEIHSLFKKKSRDAVRYERDIVFDMTNMHASARSKCLLAVKGFEKRYEKILIVFKFDDIEDTILKISKSRKKNIPESTIKKMMRRYEKPSLDEGFDKIVEVDNRDKLSKIVDSLSRDHEVDT